MEDPTVLERILLAAQISSCFTDYKSYKPLSNIEREKVLGQDSCNLNRTDASRTERIIVFNRIEKLLNSCCLSSECTYYEYREYVFIYCELGLFAKAKYYCDILTPEEIQDVIGGDLGSEMYYRHLDFEYVPFVDTDHVLRFRVYLDDNLYGICDAPGYDITVIEQSKESTPAPSPAPIRAVDVLPGIISRHLERYSSQFSDVDVTTEVTPSEDLFIEETSPQDSCLVHGTGVIAAVDVLPGIISRHLESYGVFLFEESSKEDTKFELSSNLDSISSIEDDDLFFNEDGDDRSMNNHDPLTFDFNLDTTQPRVMKVVDQCVDPPVEVPALLVLLAYARAVECVVTALFCKLSICNSVNVLLASSDDLTKLIRVYYPP